MKIIVAVILGLLMFTAGCNSSQQPEKPKTINSYRELTPEEAAKFLRDAEAQQPCSEQNLKNASDEQRRKCNPTQGIFDNAKPKQTVKPASAKTQKP